MSYDISLGSKEFLKLSPMSSLLGPMSPKFFIDGNLRPFKPKKGPRWSLRCIVNFVQFLGFQVGSKLQEILEFVYWVLCRIGLRFD